MNRNLALLVVLTVAGTIGAPPVTGNVPPVGTFDNAAAPSKSVRAPAYLKAARLDRSVSVDSYGSLPDCGYEVKGTPFCVYPIKLYGLWCGTPIMEWRSELNEALEKGQLQNIIWTILERAPSSPAGTLLWGHPW